MSLENWFETDLKVDRQDALAALRARAHPLRLQILSLLTGTSLSAADVAEELGISNARASYHLRQLLRVGAIEIDADNGVREDGRGRPPIRYRYVWQPLRPEPGPAWEALFAAIVADLQRRAKTMSERRLLVDGETWLSRAVWNEISELAEQIASLMHENAQPLRTPGAIQTSITVSLLELSDRPTARSKRKAQRD